MFCALIRYTDFHSMNPCQGFTQ